jgi:hypothetical protein
MRNRKGLLLLRGRAFTRATCVGRNIDPLPYQGHLGFLIAPPFGMAVYFLDLLALPIVKVDVAGKSQFSRLIIDFHQGVTVDAHRMLAYSGANHYCRSI